MEGGGRVGQLLERREEGGDARLEVGESGVEVEREGFSVGGEEAVDDCCARDLTGEA